MGAMRFGQLLARLVPISEQDISEILEAQIESGHRFGWIAMKWGLCEPHHVWQAWSEQLTHGSERINLETVGIDMQSLVHVPEEIARGFGVVPVRAVDNDLILAASVETIERAAEQLPRLLGKRVKFVLATAQDVQLAIRTAYLHVGQAGAN